MTERDTDLLPGTLELLVLKALKAGRRHGYGVARHIQSVSRDVLQVEEGSLYPALHRMEKRGWIRSEWGRSESNRKARFYELTRNGRRRLATETESWQRFSSAVARVLRSEPGPA